MTKISRLSSSSISIQADVKAIKEFSIPSEILMENAGSACADFAASMTSVGDTVLIMAGVGSNGGDGMVMARHLDRLGRKVFLFIAGDEKKVKGASLTNLLILKSMNIPCVEMSLVSDEFIKDRISESSLVVDALLGTGASGDLRGQVLRAVQVIDGFSPVLSVDGPTGVDMDDGTVSGKAVSSDLTVTMVSKKVGHEVYPGKRHSGRVEVVHIGIASDRITDFAKDEMILVDEGYVRRAYPQTACDSHKYSRGCVLLVAGSDRYPGAAALSSIGALRAGAGVCVLAAPDSVRPYVQHIPEVIFESLNSKKEIPKIISRWGASCSVVVLGPGLGRSALSRDIFTEFWSSSLPSVVVDGDGLFFLPEADISSAKEVLITPHEGEAARLMGWPRERVSQQRLLVAGSLAGRYGTCLLKGPGSLVCSRQARGVISSGNATLSVAGSGDVLAGAIGALWSRGCIPFDAAALGGWIHGKSGELLSSRSTDGALASEIANKIPDVLGGLF